MEKLEAKIEALQEKQEAIEERACEHDRDMTEKEQERYEALDEDRQKAIQTIYPQKISEAEPKKYGGN